MTIAKVSPYEQHLTAAADEVIRLRGLVLLHEEMSYVRGRYLKTATAKLRCATRNTYALGLAMFVGGLLMGAVIRWTL